MHLVNLEPGKPYLPEFQSISKFKNGVGPFGGARELENEREIAQYFKAAVAAAEEEHVLAVGYFRNIIVNELRIFLLKMRCTSWKAYVLWTCTSECGCVCVLATT